MVCYGISGVVNCTIHWIVIYPVDSVIHVSDDWGQGSHSVSQSETQEAVLEKVFYWQALPRGPTPYPFTYHCRQKRCPFSIPSINKWYPFHRPSSDLCNPFNR